MWLQAKAFRLSLIAAITFMFLTNYCQVSREGILLIPRNVPQYIAISIKIYYIDNSSYSKYFKVAILISFFT